MITSNPCSECGKLHSVLSAPVRRIDDDGISRSYSIKTCVCGHVLGEIENLVYSSAWKISKPIKTRAMTAIQDDESQAVMVLWDEGKYPAKIAKILGSETLHIKHIVRKIIKAFPEKAREPMPRSQRAPRQQKG